MTTSRRLTVPPRERAALAEVLQKAVDKTPGSGIHVTLYNQDEWTYYILFDADGHQLTRDYWNNRGDWVRDFKEYANADFKFSDDEIQELYKFLTANRSKWREKTPLVIWGSYLEHTPAVLAESVQEEVAYSDFSW